MRILVVSFIFPFPVDSGGARDIFTRLVALRRAGFSIDLIATVRAMPAESDLQVVRSFVDSIQIVQRSRRVKDLFRLDPFHCASRAGLQTIPLAGEYGAVLLESDFVGGILENVSLRAGRRILRIHNDESLLHRCLARESSRILDRILFFAESLKFHLYSQALAQKCDELWFISSRELERASQNSEEPHATVRSHLVRSTYQPADFRHRPLFGSTVLYVGAFSISINARGLIWYLQKVHPHMLADPAYRLLIAGKRGSGSVDALMEIVGKSTRVELRSDVGDVDPLYEGAAAFINPIQFGAGVKLKTLDAAAQGLPVVTTIAGVEGTGFSNGTHAIVANTWQSFLLGLQECLADKGAAQQMVLRAQSLMQRENGTSDLQNVLGLLQQQGCERASPSLAGAT